MNLRELADQAYQLSIHNYDDIKSNQTISDERNDNEDDVDDGKYQGLIDEFSNSDDDQLAQCFRLMGVVLQHYVNNHYGNEKIWLLWFLETCKVQFEVEIRRIKRENES